ncbi:hypothetical protein OZN62_06515 [Aurantiacibacter sp. MUD11]|uniref:hypothetical protein n=1 Tax=Aurantiacibacter sp. MUD11 TaxID=3003265 RepID=UPI0022AA0CD9|nr:hypothetical protein [Aurantiacibacter sp. MUD11]WAT19214.1 hypothetical protein OZN62_06515 [Aurantiacibacter sp. MUD11]
MKFDMGKAWNEAMAMIGANRELLMVLAGIFFLLPTLLVSLVGPTMPEMPITSVEDFERFGQLAQAMYAEWWWLFVLATLIQVLGYLCMLALLRDGSRPTVGMAITDGLKALVPAILAYIVFAVGLTLALGLLAALTAVTAGILALVTVPLSIIGGIYVAVKVSLSAPVIAVEKVYNPFKVLARSWKLTKGNSLRLFGFFLLIFVAYIVISAVLGLVIAGVAALLGPDSSRLVVAVISAIVSAIATVVMVAALAAAHRQLAGPSDEAVSETFS